MGGDAVVGALIAVAIPALSFVLLIAIGFDLTTSDFARVARQRQIVIAGLVAPLVLLPVLALALIWVFQPPADVAAGGLLIAACPIGSVSNTYSYLAKASTALSISLTGLSSVAAIATIPLVSRGFEIALDQPFGYTAPVPVLVFQLGLLLLLPVAIGMAILNRAPGVAARHGGLLRRLAVGGTVLVLLLIVAENPSAFAGGLSTTVPFAAAFVIGSILLGWAVGILVTSDRRDRFTLVAGFGARNVGVAMAIAVTILGRVEFARFAVTYAIVEVPLMLVAVALFRRGESGLAVPAVTSP